ncbi:MAG: sulfotransferase [Cyanobacteriota bacterium]|nr:sulfotransferase [Cyanobacteriota bacterium]
MSLSSSTQTKLPNFLIIGVQKAGTSSIYHYLKQHPQVYMSPVKETNFFERDWENAGAEACSRKKNGIYTFAQYSQLFEDVTDEIAIGEASPNYLFHYEKSAQLIQKYLPDVKLIAILRNPIDRAYSDYLMHVRDCIGKPQPFAKHIQKSKTSFTIRKGLYYEGIKHYLDRFGSDRVQVYLYEDLCRDSVKFMQDMYRFLGVDDTFNADTSKKSQVAQVPKNQAVNRLLRTENPVRSIATSALKVLLPPQTRKNLRSALMSWNAQEKSKLTLSTEERQQLVNIYREDILKLQEIIQRDLSSWIKSF